jgi:hypothetical protein
MPSTKYRPVIKHFWTFFLVFCLVLSGVKSYGDVNLSFKLFVFSSMGYKQRNSLNGP